jgi:hypothetical protein
MHAAGAAQWRRANGTEVAKMRAMTIRRAALALGMALSAAAQAGGVGVGVVLPVGPMSPVVAVPIASGGATSVFVAPIVPGVIHPVAPVFASPFHVPVVPAFVPSFVPVSPMMVPTVPVLAAPGVVPYAPVMAPGVPFFFAPPVQAVVAPPAGGQIIIIRGSGF